MASISTEARRGDRDARDLHNIHLPIVIQTTPRSLRLPKFGRSGWLISAVCTNTPIYATLLATRDLILVKALHPQYRQTSRQNILCCRARDPSSQTSEWLDRTI